MTPDGYGIWDTVLDDWWETNAGKKLWKRSNDAANAWNVNGGYLSGQPKFSEQSRYVTRAVRLDPLEA